MPKSKKGGKAHRSPERPFVARLCTGRVLWYSSAAKAKMAEVNAFKQRANLQPGETVLVLGAAGGVGTTAIELAKLMGAKVVAAAGLQFVMQLRIVAEDDLP